jgi:repressor LexA
MDMGIDEIREWADAKRGRRALLARSLEIELDKVSKALSGKRQFTSVEMDKARALIRTDRMWESAEAAAEVRGTQARKIPRLGSVPAGSWREAVRNTSGSLAVSDASTPPNAFALDIDGDSMDLITHDADYVILDPDDISVFPGRLYVVINEAGESTFKKYLENPPRLMPCSSNPVHQPIVFGDGQQVQVIARVIGAHLKL